MDDLSLLTTTPGTSPDIGNDAVADFLINDLDGFAGLSTTGSSGAVFYGDMETGGLNFENSGEGFQDADTVSFPVDEDFLASWYSPLGDTVPVNGFVFGVRNWVAFQDTQGRFGWLGFGLYPGGHPDLKEPMLDAFVYDPASTSPANAITLGQAVNAYNAQSVPEPGSVLLVACAAMGTLVRRRRIG